MKKLLVVFGTLFLLLNLSFAGTWNGPTKKPVTKKEYFLHTGFTFDAVLNTAIYSFNIKTPIIAEVEHDVRYYGKIMLPRGTKIIGESQIEKSINRVNVVFHTIVFPNRSIKKQDFNSLKLNTTNLWKELLKRKYITEQGDLAEDFFNLSGYSKLKLSAKFSSQKKEIYNILNQCPNAYELKFGGIALHVDGSAGIPGISNKAKEKAAFPAKVLLTSVSNAVTTAEDSISSAMIKGITSEAAREISEKQTYSLTVKQYTPIKIYVAVRSEY